MEFMGPETTMKSPFNKADMAPIYDQIERARKKDAKNEQPPEPAEDPTAEEVKARDLFFRRHTRIREVLPWITQPSGCSFENYEAICPEQKKAVQICGRFADNLVKRYVKGEGARGILFVGRCGTGKTHLASAILARLESLRMPGFFIPAIELFDLYTPSFSTDLVAPHWKVRELLGGVSCLVIDDVGADAWSAARRSRIQQVIDARISNGLPTIITSNMTQKNAEEDAGERLSSRFSGTLYPIVCGWADHRQRCALGTLSPEDVF